jgi:hypothetical protein
MADGLVVGWSKGLFVAFLYTFDVFIPLLVITNRLVEFGKIKQICLHFSFDSKANPLRALSSQGWQLLWLIYPSLSRAPPGGYSHRLSPFGGGPLFGLSHACRCDATSRLAGVHVSTTR